MKHKMNIKSILLTNFIVRICKWNFKGVSKLLRNLLHEISPILMITPQQPPPAPSIYDSELPNSQQPSLNTDHTCKWFLDHLIVTLLSIVVVHFVSFLFSYYGSPDWQNWVTNKVTNHDAQTIYKQNRTVCSGMPGWRWNIRWYPGINLN